MLTLYADLTCRSRQHHNRAVPNKLYDGLATSARDIVPCIATIGDVPFISLTVATQVVSVYEASSVNQPIHQSISYVSCL